MSEPTVVVSARSASYTSATATGSLSITWQAAQGTITQSEVHHRVNGAGWLKDTMFPSASSYTHQLKVNCGPGDVVEWYAKVWVSWQLISWYFEAPIQALYGESYNAALTTTDVSPANQATVYGNQPYIVLQVGGAAGGLHGHLQLALEPFPAEFLEYDVRSELNQTGWERSASPYTTWLPLGPGGANNGDRLRWQAPPLRYDIYYIRSRIWAGGQYGNWSGSTRWFETVPTAAPALSCTIGAEAYQVEGLRVTERTGGDASELEFKIPLKEYRARPFASGAAVAVGLHINGQWRGWNGRAEVNPGDAAHLTVHCVQDDAALARLLVLADTAEADIGANLATVVDQYGDRLSSAGIDTSLGVNAAIAGAHKSVRDHLKEWADTLDLLLYVDQHRVVHLVDPADLGEPELILYEEYR